VHFAGGYGTLGEAEQVGAFGVLGTEAALVGREFAAGVDAAFIPVGARVARWLDGTARDLSSDQAR
jgi:hypothetical protein